MQEQSKANELREFLKNKEIFDNQRSIKIEEAKDLETERAKRVFDYRMNGEPYNVFEECVKFWNSPNGQKTIRRAASNKFK